LRVGTAIVLQHVLLELDQLALCIVSGTSVLVADDLVGGLDFVELIRGDLLLGGILDLVGVELEDEFAVSCLDSGSRGISREAQGQIWVGR
jgi:hypothetical protein